MSRKTKALVAATATLATTLSAVALTVATAQADTPAAQQPAPRTAKVLTAQERSIELSRANSEAPTAAATLGLGAKERLVAKDVVVDTDGTRHIRYDRLFNQVPVVGGDVIVHKAADGRLGAVDKATTDVITVPTTTPAIQASRAAAVAPALTLENKTGVGNAELVVYAVNRKPVLAYRTTVETRGGSEVVVTDAATGALLDRYEERHEATGTGFHNGQVTIDTTSASGSFTLTDAARGNTRVLDANNGSESNPAAKATAFTDADNVWGTGQLTSRQTAAVDAAYGLAKTWDYFKNTFARNGIRNDGRGTTMYVHTGTNLLNAYYSNSCFCMVFGDGSSTNQNTPLTSLDVVGHEMTHGVTAATANLNYSGESGGLNEAASDIFGTMVEFSANNAADPGDYYIGEKLRMPGGYLRRMDNPAADRYSLGCWSSSANQVDVHYSSGIGNRWFYLASEGTGTKTIGGLTHVGGTCNNTTFAGIGKDKAAKIFYRALTTYMTSTTNYAGARSATLQAAADLYGTNSQERYLVSVAWAAVSVGTALTPPTSTPTTTVPTTTSRPATSTPTTTSRPATSTPTTTSRPATSTPTTTVPTTTKAPTTTTTPPPAPVVANGGFELGQVGWSETPVVTNSTLQAARTGSFYAWILGNGRVASEAISQQVKVPTTGTPALRYWLKVTTRETGTGAYDILRVQLNNVTKQSYSNRDAGTAYVERVLDLSGYKGQTVTVRFSGLEDATLATNFLVDDITVTS